MSVFRTGTGEPRPEPPPSSRSRPVRASAGAVDASMRLLRDVMEHPLDPAYEIAARRRSAGARPGRAGAALTVVLALLCGVLAARSVSELNRPEPGQAAGRAALEREITRRTAQADAQQLAIENLRSQIAEAQRAQLTSPEDVDLAARAGQLALQAGEVPVTGPGLEVTMQDAPSVDPGQVAVDPRAGSSDDGRVIDRDIQVVVNGLWSAGAEAISINGRRLTALAAIRSAGEAILVDFRPLVPPYVIQAVGDPATLQSRFTAGLGGSYVQDLRNNYDVGVDISTATELRLPGAGTFELRVAVAPDTGGPSGPTGSVSGSRRAPSSGSPPSATSGPPGRSAGSSASPTVASPTVSSEVAP